MSKCFWRCVSVVRDYTDRHCRHLNARPSLDRFTLRSPEDAALQNRSVSDRPAHAHPKAPRVGGCCADTECERANDGASGQEDRASMNVPPVVVAECIDDLARGNTRTDVQRAVADGGDVLKLPEVARAGVPVVRHAQLAHFEAGEAAGPAERESAVQREIAAEVGTSGESDPEHVAAKRNGEPEPQFGALPGAFTA